MSRPLPEQARQLGPVLATLLMVGNLVGSGIFLLPATLASVGGISLLGWLAGAAGALLLAVVFSALVILRPEVDGVADYARIAAGRYAGFQSGFAYWVSNWTGTVAIALAVTGYLTVFLPALRAPAASAAATIAVIWLLTGVNALGPGIASRFGGWTLALGALPVVAVAMLGWLWFDPALYARNWNPGGRPLLQGTQASLLLIFWAYTGMESGIVAASVVRRPERNVPIATVAGLLIATAIFIAATSAILGLVPAGELGHSSAPFALALGRMAGPALAGLVAACAMLKAAGTAGGITLLTAETTRASAATGYFPAFLARVNRRGASINALIFLGVLETATVLLTISPTLGRQFQTLIDVSTLLTLVMYGWCAAAALRISGKVARRGLRLGLRACAGLSLGFCVWTAATSELKLLLISLGFLALTVPLWLAVQASARARALAASASKAPAAQ